MFLVQNLQEIPNTGILSWLMKRFCLLKIEDGYIS